MISKHFFINIAIAIASLRKKAARTHTVHMFQKSFCTGIALVGVWAHVMCVRERGFIFTTHSLICNNPLISTFFALKVLEHDQAKIILFS